MTFSKIQKEELKKMIKMKLSNENEIQKIILFGSFVNSNTPNDLDVAIFQDSEEKYYNLAMRYRKLLREISRIIPLDILPLKMGAESTFLDEIEKGETIYEK
ncbi:MAG: nucleotidyltransferase domain-containing protein [Candidatus Cloacimonadales bacterium]|nr:nucleotidyltransferase domain-containing protein [Candidatus Cloacimonadales bacterium]